MRNVFKRPRTSSDSQLNLQRCNSVQLPVILLLINVVSYIKQYWIIHKVKSTSFFFSLSYAVHLRNMSYMDILLLLADFAVDVEGADLRLWHSWLLILASQAPNFPCQCLGKKIVVLVAPGWILTGTDFHWLQMKSLPVSAALAICLWTGHTRQRASPTFHPKVSGNRFVAASSLQRHPL